LGDLFDEWICPAKLDPTASPHPDPPEDQQFYNISRDNAQAIEALKTRPRKLVYVAGNHDMLVKQTTMETIFPNIVYTHCRDGHDVYKTRDGIWSEHGHWYGIGNAPHPASTGTPFGQTPLPMGFFFSRLSAQEVWIKGTEDLDSLLVFAEIFKGWLEEFGGHDQDGRTGIPYSKFRDRIAGARDEFLKAEKAGLFNRLSSKVDKRLIDSLARDFSAWIIEHGFDSITRNTWCPPDGPTMDGLENIKDPLSWRAVEDRYEWMFADWKTNHPGNVENWEAIICDFWSLLPAVGIILSKPKVQPVPKIVIMGHTHEKCLVQPPSPSPAEGQPADWVYINAGAWIDDKPCTYVETEYDKGSGKHTCWLKKFNENGDPEEVLKEAYVIVGGKGSRTRRPRPVVAAPRWRDPRLV
jgi:hypothetical protein